MGRSGPEEPELETCEPRRRATAGRWFVRSSVDESQSSGRLSSSFDLRAERTDDGVLVAPVAEGSSSAAAASTGGNELADIASTLRRIEATLDRIADDRPAD